MQSTTHTDIIDLLCNFIMHDHGHRLGPSSCHGGGYVAHGGDLAKEDEAGKRFAFCWSRVRVRHPCRLEAKPADRSSGSRRERTDGSLGHPRVTNLNRVCTAWGLQPVCTEFSSVSFYLVFRNSMHACLFSRTWKYEKCERPETMILSKAK